MEAWWLSRNLSLGGVSFESWLYLHTKLGPKLNKREFNAS